MNNEKQIKDSVLVHRRDDHCHSKTTYVVAEGPRDRWKAGVTSDVMKMGFRG